MVDGDSVDDDGGEDGKEIPLPGVESRTNLTPKTKIVVAAELHIANRSVLLGLRVSHIYQASRERRRQGDALGPKETCSRAPGLSAHEPPSFGRRVPSCLVQNPNPPHMPAGEVLTHGDGDEAHG